MSKKEKLIEKLRQKSKDFTFDEMNTLLTSLGFQCYNKGKTSGSRVLFLREDGISIILHKPHPNKELAQYQIRQILKAVEEEKLI